MKISYFKALFVLILPFYLNSCAIYINEAKYEKKVDIKDTYTDKETEKFLLSLVRFDQMTKEYIIGQFGEPDSIEKDGNTEILNYEKAGPFPHNTIWIVLPIKYKSGDEYYKYSFHLHNNKLESVSFEELKRKAKGIVVLPPMLVNKNFVLDMNPFEDNKCNDEFKKVFGTFPNMHSGHARMSQKCFSSKLFGVDSIRTRAFDKSRYNDGYTKIVFSNVFLYNKNVIASDRKNLEKYYKKTAEETDRDRMTDYTIKERAYKTEHLDCKIFMRSGKDYKAANKGDNLYLILEDYGALCFTKKPDMVVDIQNSNRFPKHMQTNIDTYKELLSILDSIKIKD